MRQAVTEDAFKKKLKAKHGKLFKLVGEYVRSSDLTEFRCTLCREKFLCTPNNILTGYANGCGPCSSKARGVAGKQKARLTYAAKLKEATSGAFVPDDDYDGATKPCGHICTICDNVVMARPNSVLSNKSLQCPLCGLADDHFAIGHRLALGLSMVEAIKEAYPHFVIHKAGRIASQKVDYTCTICNTRQNRNISILRRAPCLGCGKISAREKLRLGHDEYVARVRKIYGPKIQVVGTYHDRLKRLRHKCMDCFKTWKSTPANILQNTVSCPSCVRMLRAGNFTHKSALMKEYTLGKRLVRVQGYEPQALTYLTDVVGFRSKDIIVESEGGVPVVEYKTGKRHRRYFPDMFIKKDNAIIEVKSDYTLGMGKSRRHRNCWNLNRLKAYACQAAGYQFSLMLIDAKGSYLRLPDNWPSMKMEAVQAYIKSMRALGRSTEFKYDKLGV